MSTIKRSKTDAFNVKESVNIVKLAEAAFEQISIDQLTDVVVETPTDGDTLVYSSDLMAWENVPQGTLDYDLEDLDNITITSVSDGQVLTWDSGTSKWVNETPTTGATTLDGLTDVTISTPSNGQVLKYNGSAWVNGADSGATPGGSDTHVQFNDSGALGGESTFTYNKTNNELTVSKLKTNNISGIVATDQMTIVTGENSTIAGIGLSPSAAAPTFVTEMSVYDIYHAGNTKTVSGQSINGTGDIAINRTITAQFEGGSTGGNLNNIEVGAEVVIRSPYAITLSDWTLLLSDSTGNVSIDVQTKPFSSGSFYSITSSGTPSAISGDSAEGTVSGWSSSSITSGHLIKLVVTARSGVVPRATLQLNGVQA